MKYLPLRIILSLTISAFSVIFASGQGTADTRPLAPGQSIEREMTGAETHRYTFELKKDEFFQVRVEQKGVDVALKLLDAEGKELASMDSPNGKEGFEVLTWVGATASSLYLEVSGFEADQGKGNYLLKRNDSRAASPADVRRVVAENAFMAGMAARKKDGADAEAVEKLGVALKGWQEFGEDFLISVTAPPLKSATASLTYDQAYALFKQKTVESYAAALPKFLEAGQLYIEIDSKNNAAISLFWAALISNELGKQDPALDLYERSATLFESDSDFEWQAYSLNKIGSIYQSKGERRKTIDYFSRALELFRKIDKKPMIAQTLVGLGFTYEKMGETNRAFDSYTSALSISREVKERNDEAAALSGLASILNVRIEKQKAIEHYNEALKIWKEVKDTRREIEDLVKVGDVYGSLNNYTKAIEYKARAVDLSRQLKDVSVEFLTSMSLAESYLGADQPQLVDQQIDRLIKLVEQSGDKGPEAQTFLGLLMFVKKMALIRGSVVSGENLYSIEELEKTLAIAKGSSFKGGEAIVTIAIGLRHYEMGRDPAKAIPYFETSLKLLEDEGYTRMKSRIYGAMALAYFELNDPHKGLLALNSALAVDRDTGNRFDEANNLSVYMLLWERLGNKDAAVIFGKQGVNLYQEIRRNIKDLDEETTKKYLGSVERAYRKLADLLIEQGRFAQAEQVLAMLKEEEYFSFVRRDPGEISTLSARVPLDETEKALIARYTLLADKVTAIGQEFGKLEDKKRLLTRTNETLSTAEQKRFGELEKQLADANAAFQLFLTKELVNEIGKEKAAAVDVDRSMQGKLKKWGEGTVALYTVAGDDRYRVVLTTAKTQVDGKTEIKIADLNKKVFAFRAALQNPNLDPRPIGKELYDILIKPIEKDLKAANAKTLLWSLDGTLRYIPLAALSPDGQRYLVEDYQNVILTPKTRKDLTVSSSNWRALGLGVSEGASITSPEDGTRKIPFTSLPGTERELFSIVRNEGAQNETGVLPGSRFINKDFTAENLINSLSIETDEGKRKFNVVHIASHFYLGSSDSNSFILLGNGKIMTLAEIRNSPSIDFEDVELVALSACNTAFADSANGKEIDSLASVIQTKSGRSVLATLWAVADESTSLVMAEFYRIRKEQPKLTKAAAMQMAQRAMIEGRLKPTSPENNAVKGIKPVSEQGAKPVAPPFTRDPARPFAHPYYWSPFVLIGNWR